VRRALIHLSGVVTFSAWGWSQPTQSPTFDAADIHPSEPASLESMRGPFVDGARYQLRLATMADLIASAYGIAVDRVWGGPSWLEWDRFDIIARMPASSNELNKEKLNLMLRQLLSDRFKLAVHNDSEPMPALALTAGKALALKRSDGAGDSGCKFEGPAVFVDAEHPAVWGNTCRNVTMAEFADEIAEMDETLKVPVIDKTGLDGKWNFSFKMTFRVPNAQPGVATSFFEAMEKLGLKLEPTTAPRPVIVVDRVNRAPTPNVSHIAELLPPTPPIEFDVATIKPSNPSSRVTNFQVQPGGRVNVRGMPLNFLVALAWQVTPDSLFAAPGWMSADRWDITAKAPAPSVAGSGDRADNDAAWPMLRSLLANRFKLQAHFEEKPMEAYTLLAGKPKLKPADPATRTKCQSIASSGAKDDPRNRNPALSRLVRCQNMTVTQFAQQLQHISEAYFHYPVLDATGIEGSFDFVVNFSPVAVALGGRARGGDGAGANAVEASDPNGGITLPEAIEKQLGLKLELQKRPVKVLVIDHVEQKPTEN
jgi:uncharacterized protein (TIGR03435 family)